MLIDTHCHLNFKVFENDWQEVMRRAQKAGVEKIIVVGTDLETSRRAVEMARQKKGLYAAVGLHPHYVGGLRKFSNFQFSIFKQLKSLAKSKKVVAIGECGLDYHQSQNSRHPAKNLQKRVFGMQIQLAKELNLPLIIHNREAHEDVLDVLNHFCKDDGNYPRGVFHCISGDRKYLNQVLKMGFYIGVDGNVTYNKEVKRLVRHGPVERLLLETDSPYLMPEPKRSSLQAKQDKLRNEPINVKIVAEFLAKLHHTSINQIEKLTTENAEALFYGERIC
jgi:TatD DNase family protein